MHDGRGNEHDPRPLGLILADRITGAIGGTLAERDRLADVIARAGEALDEADLTLCRELCETLEASGLPNPAAKLFRLFGAISTARAILSEADPEGDDPGEGVEG